MRIIEGDLIGSSKHAYFIGIGGVGMSALARVLKHRELSVSGSDIRENGRTRALGLAGIPVFIGQAKADFGSADLIVYSSAISSEHVELSTARKLGLKVYHRAEILSSLLNRAKTSVAIAGTHGKTTTSSMISFVLSELGQKPTCLVGGDVLNLGTNALLGNDDLWISEIDESDRTHEYFSPNYTVLTNLEVEHIDRYKGLEDLKKSFSIFLDNAQNPGLLVFSKDDQELEELVGKSGKPFISFGFLPNADYSASNIVDHPFGTEFDLLEEGFFVAHIQLKIPGHHNIANALAAFALLIHLGYEPEKIADALSRFKGAKRRLEVKCHSEDLTVIDDYAHHPTEVRASIRALQRSGKPLTVVFQPHRYSRTGHFVKEFARAFEGVDDLILTDIYGAGESNPENVNIDCLYQEIMDANPSFMVRVVSRNEIISDLIRMKDLRGIIAFLGAGDIGEIANEFASRFGKYASATS